MASDPSGPLGTPPGKYRAVPHRIAPGKASGRVSLAFKLRAPLAAELVLQNGDGTTVTTARALGLGLEGLAWETSKGRLGDNSR